MPNETKNDGTTAGYLILDKITENSNGTFDIAFTVGNNTSKIIFLDEGKKNAKIKNIPKDRIITKLKETDTCIE